MQITRKNIKYLRIKIDREGQLIVSAPLHMSQRQIELFLEEKKNRIRKYTSHIQQKKSENILQPDQVILYGEIYTMFACSGSSDIVVDAMNKTIHSKYNLLDLNIQQSVLKRYAKTILTTQLQELSRKHNKKFNKIIIRDQKTKRGTCSSKKNIGLNRKLIKMPPTIAEYVICHELAHLQEMNHSPRLRAHLDTLYPDRKIAEKWLKENGMTLQ